MTSDVAVAVAVAAAVLSLVLLAVVVRQNDRARTLVRRVDDLEADRRAAQTRIDELEAESQETTQALELALAAVPPPVMPATQPEGPYDDIDVSVITDISDRLRGINGGNHDGIDGGEADLSTARIASVTLGGPLIKVAAFSHGVRHALDEEQRMRISYAVRKELRRQRKMRRRRRGDQAPSKRWG
jgi:hypothetical protein